MARSSANDAIRLLEGVVVADALPPELGMSGSILAHLGATVVRIADSGQAPSRADLRWQEASWVWVSGQEVAEAGSDEGQELQTKADIVLRWVRDTDITSGSEPASGEATSPPARPQVTVIVSPFGIVGPRAPWMASDLGVAAASGNLWATGDPDRPPVRCAAPLSAVHLGAEAVMAALTALAGGSSRADVSMAETMCSACLGAPAMLGATGDRGHRTGSLIGLTQEIWRCRDGWVSFGLRGGPARIPSLRTLAALAADRGDGRLAGVEWEDYNPRTADPAFLATLTAVLGDLFAGLTLVEFDALASEEGVLVAPIVDAQAIQRSSQLAARNFFDESGLPRSFVTARRPGGSWQWLEPRASSATGMCSDDSGRLRAGWRTPTPQRPWAETRIVVLGSGVAGPLIGRYFAEQGATVVRVESASRPDFLRLYAAGPQNPHGLEGSGQFAWSNAGMLGVSLDLKHPEGRRLLLELVRESDAVVENFTTSTLDRLGLGWEVLSATQPGIVLLSTSFNGQTGPRCHEAGFGSLGSAASGFNHLTGWEDRAPIGPATTITDSLNPRFGAAVLAAALLHRRRTGGGLHIDLSQVECALFSLKPWLAWSAHDQSWARAGNRAEGAVPHGLYPCTGDDHWVAIAVWSDAEWVALRNAIGWAGPPLASLDERVASREVIDAAVTSYTVARPADAVAEHLQALGVEAVPVADYRDLATDPTLAARHHFVTQEHPVLGTILVERSGYRLEPDRGDYERTAPTMGRDNRVVLETLGGLSPDEVEHLLASSALR